MEHRYKLLLIIAIIVVAFMAILLQKQQVSSDISTAMTPVDRADYVTLLNEVGEIPQPTLVHFFSSWCSTCVVDHQMITELSPTFNMIGIATMDKKDEIDKFLKKHGNPYKKVIWDESGSLAIATGVRGLPETFLLTTDKIWRHTGALSKLVPPKKTP